jgi:ABC-2 type transport system ATP-binding protein
VSVTLNVNALAKRYGGRSKIAQQALRDVSFRLSAGELVAVVGPNGAGKTTLLSIISGIQSPSAGTVGRGAGEGRWAVGWVPQASALYSKLSVAENLELFAHLEGIADTHAVVRRMLEQTGLAQRAHEPVGRLSGGNRQRVNVALGLLADPPVLALDEPTAALDPGQRERLWEFVAARVAGGTTVVFSTHNVSEAQRHADRLLVLGAGRLLFDGTAGELLARGREHPGGDLERALVRFLNESTSGAERPSEHAGSR